VKKRSMVLAIISIVMLLSLPLAVYSADRGDRIPKMKTQQIEVLVNARKVKFPDQRPKLEDKLSGKLDLKGNEITIVKGDRTVKLVIGANTATVNGETITLGVKAQAENGRTYVPLRFISEALGERVEWDKVTRFVWIGSKDIPELSDIVQPKDFKQYEPYFNGDEGLMKICYKVCAKATQAYEVSADDLPFTVRGEAYYRFDLSFDDRGTWIRATTTDKGVMPNGLLYLNPKQEARLVSGSYHSEENVSDFRFMYYNVSMKGNPKTEKYTIDQADYLALVTDYQGYIFIKNPLK